MNDIMVTPHPTTHLDSLKEITGKADAESFLFEMVSGGRRFIYSGDLGSPEDLHDVLLEPADLLICELATFFSGGTRCGAARSTGGNALSDSSRLRLG